MAAMSSGVAGSRAAPRSPMTCRRRAPWGTWRATSTSKGRPSIASMNSGKDCQFHVQALGQDDAGDVLDALHQLDEAVVVLAGWTGAKPTPQLPATTVVTPCHDDGIMRSPHEAWPS